jgi:glycogen debranching enzyme
VNEHAPTAAPTAAWDVALDHAICGNPEDALGREWLVTNGLGGYASGTIAGATTRRYHGLLVAALRPPVARTVLVTKVDEEVSLADGQRIALGTNEYADGTISPAGYVYLEEFALEGSVARFRYRLDGGIVLEKRIWMEHGRNTTYVRYRLVELPPIGGSTEESLLTLTLAPFCVCRDHHAHERGAPDWRFLVEPEPGGCRVRAWAEAAPSRLAAGPSATFTPTGLWYWHVLHRAERERGLDDEEDVYQPGTLAAALRAGATLTLVASAEDELGEGFGVADHEAAGAAALERERARARTLLARAAATQRGATDLTSARAVPDAPVVADRPAAPVVASEPAAGAAMNPLEPGAPLDPVLGRLVLAADQFLVARAVPGAAGDDMGSTGIAGYHWFADWGRDTMISLPGLTLATGRAEIARSLLSTFARFLDRGMLPNRFPDGGEALTDDDFNTADATLWYFVALDRYLAATGDRALLAELFPALADVVSWHQRGTRFGIGVDSRDGLLRAGAPGVQLTWMDAKMDDWVVTPRRGKPVEINGLWHNALALMEEWAGLLGHSPQPYAAARARAGESFAARFWYTAGGYLYDVVDVDGVEGATDAALRPNQVIALALRHGPPVGDEQARTALAAVERHLLTPLGLRSLSPEDPAFQSFYTGDRRARDSAYHQGPVWPWLIGPYLDVRLRLAADRTERDRVRALILESFREHLLEAGVGSISEIAEPLAPFRPVGCIAQAWSVAEVLRWWAAIV